RRGAGPSRIQRVIPFRMPAAVRCRSVRAEAVAGRSHPPMYRGAIMRSWRFPLLALLALAPGTAWAQQASRTEPVTGLRENPPGVHAFTGARIVVAPGRVLENATL